MFIVALTGGIGCGKSEATKAFAKLSVPIIDLDIISHQITAAEQPIIDDITAHFGQRYVTEAGALDRDKMRKLVFDEPSARNKLNAILHPAIYEEALKQRQSYRDAPYTILAIPLLEPNGLYMKIIDRILVIDCDEATQIKRVKQRSQLNETQIKQIIKAQISRETRRAMADDIIKNDRTISELCQKIKYLHQNYLRIS